MVRVQILTGDDAVAPHLVRTESIDTAAEFVPPEMLCDVQPLGVFSYPAGLLVIEGDEYAALRRELAAGRRPSVWPPELAGIAAAYDDKLTEAADLLAARAEMTDHPVDWLNLAAVAPERVDLDRLLTRIASRWQSLAQLVLAHLGRAAVPAPDPEAPAEVRALVAAARAADLLNTDVGAAMAMLDDAVAAAAPAPALQALMLGARADAGRHRESGHDEAIADLRRALALLADSDLRVARAELHLALGQLLHEQAATTGTPLGEAAAQFQSCLQTIESGEAPLTWAAAHTDLAAAYLTMPMASASDQLRVAVAAQSLRKALKVYTRDDHPDEWAATSVNLANALVYAPSAHQQDNLVEAVNLYGEVLATRDPDRDPLGYGRVLANQGNVLAHLGMFTDATATLHEARFLFETAGADDMVRAVRGVLDEIARTQQRNATNPPATPTTS
ncbi:hypothetical protein ACWDTI_04740 [Gordonia sp. NPDC003424]